MSGDGLTEEGRKRLSELARDRPITCPKCGGRKHRVKGSTLAQDTHFAELEYEICYGCGWERPVTRRKRKGKL